MRIKEEDKYFARWKIRLYECLYQGKKKDAEHYLDLFIKSPKHESERYYHYYLKSLLSDNDREKLQYIDRCLELKPGFVYGLIERAFLSSSLRKALNILKSGFKFHRNAMNLRIGIGIIYGYFGNNKKAIDTYNKILKDDPSNARVFALLSLEYLEQKNIEKAEDNVKTSLNLDPILGDGHLIKGFIEMYKRNYDISKKYFLKAQKLSKNNVFKKDHEESIQVYIERAQNAKELVQLLEPIDVRFKDSLTNNSNLIEMREQLKELSSDIDKTFIEVSDIALPSNILKLLHSKHEYFCGFIDIMEFNEVDFNKLHKLKEIFLEWSLNDYISLLLDLEKFYLFFRNKQYNSLEDVPDSEQTEVLFKIRPFSVLGGDFTNSALDVINKKNRENKKHYIHIIDKLDEISKNFDLPDQNFKFLMKILNTIPPKFPHEPNMFKNISHDILCNQFELFLRNNMINKNIIFDIVSYQSLRENGVDLLLTFIESKLKIGFQFKSYGDIQTKNFSNTVDSQITRSEKICKYYFIAFGGDLTNKSHREKINGKISEIKQLKRDYVQVIPPGIFLTIIEGEYN